jgi:ubiquitin C-terminal hydrolase
MRIFELYKHVNCRDVAIMPKKIYKLPHKLIIKIKWFNVVNPANKFDLHCDETIEIKTEDISKWKYLAL